MFDRIGILTLAALLAAGLVLAAGAYAQTTWYVDDDAPNDPGPGDPGVSDPDEDGSAEHPFDAIQEGINAAVDADEVVVADGTYTGYGNRDLDFGGKAIAVRSENGPDNCVIDCEAGPDDWHWGFYFHNNEDGNAIVDGLTITDGYSDPGGGIFCYGAASPTLVSCVLTGNEAYSDGGAIYCGASTTMIACTLSGNVAGERGGGAYACGNVTIAACTFAQNLAHYGGAIACGDGSPTTISCTINDNWAIIQNYQEAFGGGIDCGDATTVIGCTITDNRAGDGFGGGISCWGDSVVSGCTIAGNGASYGGGNLFCGPGNQGITNCTLAYGWADQGGGLSCYQSTATVANCTIANNTAVRGGGGTRLYQSAPTIVNCTLAMNRSINGGGGGVRCQGGLPILANCILWGNSPQQIYANAEELALTYSDVEGGWEGTGNIDVDPLFVDSDGPDDDPNTWEDNNYRLLGESPCIDAGDNSAVPAWVTSDLDRRLRFADRIGTPDTGAGVSPIVDMGAYEYQCAGDLDGDGEIDLADLGALLATYGASTWVIYADGDLDQDGDVDLTDLATLLAAYGTTCE